MEQKTKTQHIQKQQTKKESKFKQFIKKYWAIILAALFMIMWMSKCSSSCSANRKVNYQTHVIDSLKVVNDTLRNSLNFYTALYQAESKHNDNFKSVAVGNQTELYTKINDLDKDIAIRDEEIKNLKSQINALKKENNELKSELENLKQ